jgi:hypothetical protein
MKIVKLVLGVISILVFGIGIILSLVNSFMSDDIRITTETINLGSILVLAFSAVFVIAGIIGIVTRKSKGGGITAGALYLFAALIGFVSLVGYSGLTIWAVDLVIWAVTAVIFGIVFIIGSANITKLARKQRS